MYSHQHTDNVKGICQDYNKRIALLEEQKYDLEYAVSRKDFEVSLIQNCQSMVGVNSVAIKLHVTRANLHRTKDFKNFSSVIFAKLYLENVRFELTIISLMRCTMIECNWLPQAYFYIISH